MRAFGFTAFFGAALVLSSAALGETEDRPLPQFAPMPLERPAEAPARADAKPAAPRRIEIAKEMLANSEKACRQIIETNVMAAELAEPAMWDNGCGAPGQLTISAIRLKNGKQVPLRPSALIRCETAEVFAEWVREDLAPMAEPYGGLARIDVAASFHCRPRNNIRGALMSEHGRANAIDIRAIVLNDGRRFGVDLPETPIQVLNELRRSTCAKFTTVLGPGSDGFHEDHVHLDLAQRRGGLRLCQWNLPTPPEPRRHPLRVADPATSTPASP